MARVMDIDDAVLNDWLRDRPLAVREMAKTHPPGRLYRMKSTGHRVTLDSYAEDRTCRVHVSGKYNLVHMERSVFGVSIDDLVECDLPGADEPLGSLDMSPDEVRAYLAGTLSLEDVWRQKLGTSPDS